MPTIAQQLSQLVTDKGNLVTNLQAKGIDAGANETFTSLVPKVLEISGNLPSKYVNFYDYDGTIVKSYTKEEIQALTVLPNVPTHAGLTSTGWNWALADIKSQDRPLDVGATYTTSNGETRIYVSLDRASLTPTLSFAQTVANGVIVDWGDESQTESSSTSGSTTLINFTHTYSMAGDYVIKLTVTDGLLYINGVDLHSTLLWDNATNITQGFASSSNFRYADCITKIEVGDNVRYGDYAFAYLPSLKTITIPQESSIFAFGNSILRDCYSLMFFAIPQNISQVPLGAFTNCTSLKYISLNNRIVNFQLLSCYSLERLCLPSTVKYFNGSDLKALDDFNINRSLTTFNMASCDSLKEIIFPYNIGAITQSAFQYNSSLTRFVVPIKVNSIDMYVFRNCYSLRILDLTGVKTSIDIPTLISYNAFENTPDDLQILVPNNLVTTWKSRSQWNNANVVDKITGCPLISIQSNVHNNFVYTMTSGGAGGGSITIDPEVLMPKMADIAWGQYYTGNTLTYYPSSDSWRIYLITSPSGGREYSFDNADASDWGIELTGTLTEDTVYEFHYEQGSGVVTIKNQYNETMPVHYQYGVYNENYCLIPGAYTFTISCSGYITRNENVTITNQNELLTINLTPEE